MIERVVLIKFTDEYATDAARAEIATAARRAFAGIPGVQSFSIGVPIDEHAIRSWDLSITVRFNTLSDVAPYRDDPLHRAFIDDYLKPRLEVIKAWNFEIA